MHSSFSGFGHPEQRKVGSELGQAYAMAIGAVGPVVVAVGSHQFTLQPNRASSRARQFP